MLAFKICVGVFSGTFKARMLKLGIHMYNEVLYCGIENQTPCLSSLLPLFQEGQLSVTGEGMCTKYWLTP